MRLEVAKDNLRNCDISLDDIAAEVGYASRAGFEKMFLSKIGIGPGAFRKLHKTQKNEFKSD